MRIKSRVRLPTLRRDDDFRRSPVFRLVLACVVLVCSFQHTGLARSISSAKGASVTAQTSSALVEQFKNEKVFWRQIEIAKAITGKHDASVLPLLADWLGHQDRHIRGNVAFIFASFGDPRGLQTITEILADRSVRPDGQGIPGVAGDGRYRFEQQVASDRYYAAHLLGDLRDSRGVALLVPLLDDPETQSIVPWSLAQIGDRSAHPASHRSARQRRSVEPRAGDLRARGAARKGSGCASHDAGERRSQVPFRRARHRIRGGKGGDREASVTSAGHAAQGRHLVQPADELVPSGARLVHHTFISGLDFPQIAESRCSCAGSNKPISVERDSVRKEQLLEPLALLE